VSASQQDRRKQLRSVGAAALAVRFHTTGPDLRPRTIAISIASPARLPTISSDACSATAIVAPHWLVRSAFLRPARSTVSGPRFAVLVSRAMMPASWRGIGSVCEEQSHRNRHRVAVEAHRRKELAASNPFKWTEQRMFPAVPVPSTRRTTAATTSGHDELPQQPVRDTHTANQFVDLFPTMAGYNTGRKPWPARLGRCGGVRSEAPRALQSSRRGCGRSGSVPHV
jgi:hypothetical protein